MLQGVSGEMRGASGDVKDVGRGGRYGAVGRFDWNWCYCGM